MLCYDVIQRVRPSREFSSRLVRITGNESIGNESITIAFEALLHSYVFFTDKLNIVFCQ